MGGTLTYLNLFINALNPMAFIGSRLYLRLYRLSCPTTEPIGFMSISIIGTIRISPFCAFDVTAMYPLRCASCTAYFNLYVIFISLPVLSIASARPLCYRLLAALAFSFPPAPPSRKGCFPFGPYEHRVRCFPFRLPYAFLILDTAEKVKGTVE